MAFGPKISTAPGTRPDPKFETVYDAERGGHYPVAQQPAQKAPQKGEKK
ncbi:hypothetical protein [Streptomyces sp. NPDC046979]